MDTELRLTGGAQKKCKVRKNNFSLKQGVRRNAPKSLSRLRDPESFLCQPEAIPERPAIAPRWRVWPVLFSRDSWARITVFSQALTNALDLRVEVDEPFEFVAQKPQHLFVPLLHRLLITAGIEP